MSEVATRLPSVAEAVAFLMMPASKEYRLRCLALWREEGGDAFATEIEKEFRARIRKRKGIEV